MTAERKKVLTPTGTPSMVIDMETISLSELRPKLSKTVKKVTEGSPVVVTRVNLPVSVMISWPDYQRLVAENDQEYWRGHRKGLAQAREEYSGA